jgi:hypothetical protein
MRFRRNYRDTHIALFLWAGMALFCWLSAISLGVWDAHGAALQWWNSVDDKIPELTATWLISGGHFLEGWSLFDRGPLQPIILLFTGATFMGPEASYAVGILVNAFWVVGLFILLRSLGVSPQKAFVVCIAVALVGPICINTVYPWPKLLGAGLSMLSFAMVFKKRIGAATILIALALLAHGSSLFAFVAIAPFVYFKFDRRISGFFWWPSSLRWRGTPRGQRSLSTAR